MALDERPQRLREGDRSERVLSEILTGGPGLVELRIPSCCSSHLHDARWRSLATLTLMLPFVSMLNVSFLYVVDPNADPGPII